MCIGSDGYTVYGYMPAYGEAVNCSVMAPDYAISVVVGVDSGDDC